MLCPNRRRRARASRARRRHQARSSALLPPNAAPSSCQRCALLFPPQDPTALRPCSQRRWSVPARGRGVAESASWACARKEGSRWPGARKGGRGKALGQCASRRPAARCKGRQRRGARAAVEWEVEDKGILVQNFSETRRMGT